MGAYIARRLLLVIPTLLGILVINFALVQFVPGGPIEQIIANLEGQGDVFESFAGTGDDSGRSSELRDDYVGARGLPPEFIKELEKEGLGTKATRASIVDTLFQRGYVDGRPIKATQLGIRTLGVLET